MADFIRDRCLLEKGQQVDSAVFFWAIKAWWSGPVLTKTAVTQMLGERGITIKDAKVFDPRTGKKKTGSVYTGISLVPSVGVVGLVGASTKTFSADDSASPAPPRPAASNFPSEKVLDLGPTTPTTPTDDDPAEYLGGRS